MNFSAAGSCASSDSTSWRRLASAPHALCKYAARCAASCSSAEWYNCSRRRARSASIVLFSAHAAQQPGLGESPVAFDGFRGYLQRLCGLLNFESAEKTQLHHLTLPRIQHRKLGQSLVERQDIGMLFWSYDQRFVQANLYCAAPALLITPGARKIGQDASHHPGGNSKKMRAVLPAHSLDVHK